MRVFYAGLILALTTTALPALAATRGGPAYGRLPLAFEPNRGQGDKTAQYFARGQGYTLAVYPDGAAFNLRGGKGRSASPEIRFVGASGKARSTAQNVLGRKVNYFVGSNPREWKTDIPTYGRVLYQSVYPGIDVAYYGKEGMLEYDFVVAPNANADQIRIHVSGSRPVLDSRGDLVIGEFRQEKPVAYQIAAGGEKQFVEARYVLAANEARIQLGKYDHSRQLIIDPTFVYGSYVGGSGNEAVLSVKVDGTGATYMTGFTSSRNFPVRGPQQAAYGGATAPQQYAQFGDAFVAKMNAAGTDLVYATYLGGSGDDAGVSLAIDGSGNAYVGGSTKSANFPVTASAVQKTYAGVSYTNGFYDPGDGFIAKLNPAGNQLVYATYLGGTGNDMVWSIAVDNAGNAVVGGNTGSSDFPTTADAISRSFRGAENISSLETGDGFVARLNAAGSALLYSTYLGGRSHDMVKSVALDAQGNIYACGFTFSSNFPTTAGAYSRSFRGAETTQDYYAAADDAFVTKISSAGALVYSTYLGGTYRDSAWAIAVDNTGAAYVTGRTASSNFPTANAIQAEYAGKEQYGSSGDLYIGDAFIAKLNPEGSALVYSTYIGGPGDEAGTDIVLDGAGNAYVSGLTTSREFRVTPDALQPTFAGFGGQGIVGRPGDALTTGDAFLMKVGPNGSLVYSSFYGGSGDDAAMAIALDSVGNVYMGGNTVSNNLKVSNDALQKTFGGSASIFPRGDGFITKISFATGGVATRLNVVTGFNPVGNAGSALATPFIVEVTDATGAVLPGVNVAFAATNATVNPSSATTDARGRAQTVVTLGSNVGNGTVTATVNGVPVQSVNLTINPPAAAALSIRAVVNGASFTPDVSPGTWMTLIPDNATITTTMASTVPLPTTMAGVRVLVNGTAVPLHYVSSQQINAVLPYEVAVGSAQAVIEVNGARSTPFTFAVKQAAPGIFVFGSNRAVVQNIAADGSVAINTSENPVPAGRYVVIYFTGQGPLDNPVASGAFAGDSPLSRPSLPVTITIGSTAVTPDFVGMTPGQVSLAQANVRIPADLPAGDYPLTITIGGAPSNGPTISVTDPQQ